MVVLRAVRDGSVIEAISRLVALRTHAFPMPIKQSKEALILKVQRQQARLSSLVGQPIPLLPI